MRGLCDRRCIAALPDPRRWDGAASPSLVTMASLARDSAAAGAAIVGTNRDSRAAAVRCGRHVSLQPDDDGHLGASLCLAMTEFTFLDF
jgi:hypothetical protein